jgi:hypothetical protein
MTDAHQDGNALSGPLSGVFAFDISTSMLTCAGCGRVDRLAAVHVYPGGPGVVARCPDCDNVLLRFAETPRGRWLDLRGSVALHFEPAATS